MVTLQQVEELRKYADVSFNEAKVALEETNGDILEAIINLERKGRIESPKGGGFYSSKDSGTTGEQKAEEAKAAAEPTKKTSSSFSDMFNKFAGFMNKLFHQGNRNTFEVTKNGQRTMSVPVTVLVILMLFTFWFTVPLMVVGLFFGYKYSFSGPELGKETVNRTMDQVSDVVDNLKKEFSGDNSNDKNTNS
jgi:hypothetical protein